MVPKRLVFYWAQGEAQAPAIVRRCWDAWAALNPAWRVRMFNATDARQAFADRGIPHPPATFQGQADIFRMHELEARGGVYVDAATVPVLPLDDWLPALTREGFFAFHDPYRRRPVENWFLAATPGHPIMTAWMEETVRFWQSPRRQQVSRRELDPGDKGALAFRLTSLKLALTGGAPKAKQVLEPKKRAWSVAPGGGADRPLHPYFWPHYLFEHMLDTRPDIRAKWSRTAKLGSYKDLMLRHWKRDYARMTDDDIRTLTEGSRMQKLALNGLPRDRQLDLLFALAGQPQADADRQ
ncbi:capsular polysaccharide synthesis protein [Sagittula sp. P11]|uniref:glycosyltransferase family 32 protein n=1 Tax=Sagittula sp. P11 TaxID=2009329 RepID=UPI0012FE6BA7|nr:capsular polysaccharide synthesis protein [Sagittula sp. P11]